MLQDEKKIPHISGILEVEFNMGVAGNGGMIYVISSRIRLPNNAGCISYHSERFSNIREAISWYDNIN